MHIYPPNSEQPPAFVVVRVIVATLKLTRDKLTISLDEIAESAGTTTIFAERILANSLSISAEGVTVVDSIARFKLAVQAVRHGALLQVARALTWQEFEGFSEECLLTSGFKTRKGILVKDKTRRWQIDVIGRKGSIILAVDCKHWESPGYDSKIKKAAEHQKLAVQALIWEMTAKGQVDRETTLALPIILTLFEPRSRVVDEVLVVSVEQFADFLEGVTPFSPDLPFIPSPDMAKSSIS